MPTDQLHIALEHHRAGHLRQAEALYRSILHLNPSHPQANFYLGMLILQANLPTLALGFLQSAARLNPTDAAVWHNLAQAHLQLRDPASAIEALEHALAVSPNRPESLFSLGIASLQMKNPANALLAFQSAGGTGIPACRSSPVGGTGIPACLPSETGGTDIPVCLSSGQLDLATGLAHLALADYNNAIASFQSALQHDPNLASAHFHIAAATRALHQPTETRKALLKAVEINPAYTDAWCALAALEVEGKNLDIAASLLRRAIKADPSHPTPHDALAQILEQQGHHQEAQSEYRNARLASQSAIPNPQSAILPTALQQLESRLNDPKLAAIHYALAGHANLFSPATIPSNFVTSFFDRYADTFESHLRDRLNYAVPDLIGQALIQANIPNNLDILDLGCGTGLCAPFLKPFAKSLSGVDLSPAMIEKSRARNLYDHLFTNDLVSHLQQSPRSYDLLATADVLIYIGDLNPAFQAAAASLRPNGHFILSVEAGTHDRYLFRPATRRFTHSKPYLQHLAQIHGFQTLSLSTIIIREEALTPVPGYLMLLKLP